MVPRRNEAGKNQWDSEGCGQSGKASERKQNLGLEEEPLRGQPERVEGPGGGQQRGGSCRGPLVAQRAREGGTAHSAPFCRRGAPRRSEQAVEGVQATPKLSASTRVRFLPSLPTLPPSPQPYQGLSSRAEARLEDGG